MREWPLQSECDLFYGNPRGKFDQPSQVWERANLELIAPPFKMFYAGKQVARIRIHKRCSISLCKVFENLWEASGKDQKKLDEAGVSVYGGSYNFRLMRESNTLSMHAYGCAIDLDPARNGFHAETPNFVNYPWVADAFEAESWVWGGRWTGRSRDGMHFQASRVS